MNQEKENKEDIDVSGALKDSDGSDTDAKPQEEQRRTAKTGKTGGGFSPWNPQNYPVDYKIFRRSNKK